MLNEQEKERLEILVRQKLADNFDLFDFESEVDSKLSFEENKNILLEKIELFQKPMENIKREDIRKLQEDKTLNFNYKLSYKIKSLFANPKILAIIGDVNTGKSNLIYFLIEELKKDNKFNLYTYGLKIKIKEAKEIHSINEMERVKDSILIVDEIFSLLDLENRKIKNQTENTLRLISHNNNVLLLSGVGENFKKFLSAKVNVFIYKRVTFDDLINGSRVKTIIMNYKGVEAGTTLLDLNLNEAIIYDGLHYEKMEIPYFKNYDSKINNKEICAKIVKSCPKFCDKRVRKNVIEEKSIKKCGV